MLPDLHRCLGSTNIQCRNNLQLIGYDVRQILYCKKNIRLSFSTYEFTFTIGETTKLVPP